MTPRLVPAQNTASGAAARQSDGAESGASAAAATAGVAGATLPHDSAHLHVSGAAPYIDDLPELFGLLHAALGLSPVARGRITAIDLGRLRAQPGVVAVLTALDIPGRNDCGPIVADDPILAELQAVDGQAPAASREGGAGAELEAATVDGSDSHWQAVLGTVRHVGQPVFLVVAHSREAARRAAALASQVLQITPEPAVLSARQAHALGRYVVPPMHLTRGDPAAAMAASPHRLSGQFSLGGQEQFYLEGQISMAEPQEDGGLRLHCSTQHPSEMQHAVAHALGLAAHRVQVICRRMGGAFGGKESQSALFACAAALAAQHLGRPVKLRPDRDDDFAITGRRHPFEFDWSAGFDGEGRLLAADVSMLANAGHSADLTAPVMTRALCHFDNAYWLPDVAMHGFSCRTDTQSNTAFRGFGGPQGAFAMEHLLDSIARHLGLDALAVRRANFYGIGERNTTPYGQVVTDNILHPLVDRLALDADYNGRRKAVAAFNASSPVLKRGLALTPVKFGISFNVAHFNQAGALVHIYTDGSVLVNHGGTEMGQGLHTKVAQVVAHELGLPMARVRVSATDTDKVANTSATAASTGSDLNGKAAQNAAAQLRQRLAEVFAQRHGVAADDVVFADGQLRSGQRSEPFEDLVRAAYEARVQLWSDGHYATPGLHWDRETLTGHPFFYFAYGAACAEVLVDTLSGEHRVLRVDIRHDVGRSLNPAIDRGQIEGGFIQGQGWLTTEALYWQAMDGGPNAGRLMTHAPSTYKIPTANDLAPAFHVALHEADNPSDTIHRSKAVGEPPILLPFAVFLAIRDAISAVGGHRVQPPLRAPATPEAVCDAIDAVRAAEAAMGVEPGTAGGLQARAQPASRADAQSRAGAP